MRKGRAKVKVTRRDLAIYGPVLFISSVFLAGLLGTVGFTLAWIAIELFYPPLFDVPNALLIVVNSGTYGFALLAALRNLVLRRMARCGFVFVFHFQRALWRVYCLGIIMGFYALLVGWRIFPQNEPYLTLLSMGLFFLFATPWLVYGRVIRRVREARLCILQFLAESASGRTNHFWLHEGLPAAERRLRELGSSVPKGSLYRWASYSLYRGSSVENELQSLSGLLLTSEGKSQNELSDLAAKVTVQAREAQREGFNPPRRWTEIPTTIAMSAIFRVWRRNDRLFKLFVAAILGSGILLVLSVGNPLPLPPWYVQGASLGFLTLALTVAYAIVRRKPPAQVTRLITETHQFAQHVDETYDVTHLLELVTLLSQKQETISGLEPILRRVAPKVHKELSDLLSAMNANISTQSKVPWPGIASALFLNPQTRILISDLRKDSEEWLSENAYSYEEP